MTVGSVATPRDKNRHIVQMRGNERVCMKVGSTHLLLMREVCGTHQHSGLFSSGISLPILSRPGSNALITIIVIRKEPFSNCYNVGLPFLFDVASKMIEFLLTIILFTCAWFLGYL